MSFLCCAYCNAPVSTDRNRETRQGSYSLHGAGHFCSRNCARVFLSLQPKPVMAPEDVYTFSNPPLRFRVMAQRRGPDGVDHYTVAESHSEAHALRMAVAYPFRTIVTNASSQIVFSNHKEIPGSAVA